MVVTKGMFLHYFIYILFPFFLPWDKVDKEIFYSGKTAALLNIPVKILASETSGKTFSPYPPPP